jgi:hypothetical protein
MSLFPIALRSCWVVLFSSLCARWCVYIGLYPLARTLMHRVYISTPDKHTHTHVSGVISYFCVCVFFYFLYFLFSSSLFRNVHGQLSCSVGISSPRPPTLPTIIQNEGNSDSFLVSFLNFDIQGRLT